MADDIDVGIGVKVTGDASGAKAVDDAIKQVGETAKDVAQQTTTAAQQSSASASDAAQKAISDAKTVSDGAGEEIKKTKSNIEDLKKTVETPPATGGLKDEVKGIGDALSSLSPEKAKGAVSGLSQAIVGLASGETSMGLEGLARSLVSLANTLPLPGVAAAVGVAIGGIIGAWKTLREGAGESARVVNEFGETIEEEMSRIEKWAQSQFDFANLKSAISDIKTEFDSATKMSNTFRDAAMAAINAQYGGQANSLRQQASDARSGGDESGAAALEEEAASRELIAKIAQERVELEAVEKQYEMQREKIKMQEEALEELISKERDVVSKFVGMENASVKWSGNIDAAFGGEARDKVVKAIESEIEARERLTQQTISYKPDGGNLPAMSMSFPTVEASAQVESLKGLAENFRLAKENLDSYNQAVESQKTNYQESKSQIQEEGRILAELNTQRIRAANEYSAAISGIDAGVVGEANKVAEGLSKLVDRSSAAIEDAAKTGTGMVTAVESFGKELGKSTTSASKSIEEGEKAIVEAVEGTGAEALSAGGEIKAGAEKFRTQLSEVLSTWMPSVEGLVSSGREMLSMVSGLASAQSQLAQAVAEAKGAANLALSQIRNSRA